MFILSIIIINHCNCTSTFFDKLQYIIIAKRVIDLCDEMAVVGVG